MCFGEQIMYLNVALHDSKIAWPFPARDFSDLRGKKRVN
jgi:hypothetical protein